MDDGGNDLSGKVAFVTGARGHLGSVVVREFLEAGIQVVGADLSVDSAGLVADDDADGLHWIEMDGADPASVRSAIDATRSAFDAVDFAVNLAGGFRWTLMGEATDEDIDFLIDANLRTALLLIREVLPAMKQRDSGRIILMSSKSTLNPSTGEAPYAGTKAALNAITESVADEVRESAVNINAILPSVIDTPANREEMADADFSKWVKREEIARLMLELLGPTGDPINGALIPMTGRM